MTKKTTSTPTVKPRGVGEIGRGRQEPLNGQKRESVPTSRISGKEGPSSVRIEDDFQSWLLDQAAVLKEHRAASLDWENLAEELEGMARRDRDALVSDLAVLLTHLLKLAYEHSPLERKRCERQWKLDVAEHRNRAQDVLEASGSLESQFEDSKFKAYRRARKLAGIAIAPNQEPLGPLSCPWSKELILNDDFFPFVSD